MLLKQNDITKIFKVEYPFNKSVCKRVLAQAGLLEFYALPRNADRLTIKIS